MRDSGRPTVIARLMGGLGNQMFQYAAARTVAMRIGADVLLDVSGLGENSSHYGFELAHVFDTEFTIATLPDVRKVLGWLTPLRSYVSRRAFHWWPGAHLVIEPHFEYWDRIETITRSCYLSGYWQSERYFKAAEALIRQDFKFKPGNMANKQLAEEILDSASISVHVRRGDYASNAATNKFHGLCSPEYYEKAIALLGERVDSPSFYIFSDDLAWCRQHLSVPGRKAFVDINSGPDSYNDMRLMSLCKHHIIANSTFSWWGAWLNPSREKLVVAPQRWFAADDQSTGTIYPDSWIKL